VGPHGPPKVQACVAMLERCQTARTVPLDALGGAGGQAHSLRLCGSPPTATASLRVYWGHVGGEAACP
jgi:hypothetical protein